MATLSQLVVDLSLQSAAFEKGMQQAQRSLDRLNTSAKASADGIGRITGAVGGLVRGMGFVGAAFAVFSETKNIVAASEKIKLLEASFTSLYDSAEKSSEMMGRIRESADKLGLPIADVAAASQKLTLALQGLGGGPAEVQKITEAFTILGRQSGTSVQDVNGALTQFAQALASGTLQGDELRSILERMPALTKLLAQELGVTTGELKKMGSEGKLTADVIGNVLLKAHKDLNGELSKMPNTTDQAFNRLNNALTDIRGKLDEAFNFSGMATDGLDFITSQLRQFEKGVDVIVARMKYDMPEALAGVEVVIAQVGKFFLSYWTGIIDTIINYAIDKFNALGQQLGTIKLPAILGGDFKLPVIEQVRVLGGTIDWLQEKQDQAQKKFDENQKKRIDGYKELERYTKSLQGGPDQYGPPIPDAPGLKPPKPGGGGGGASAIKEQADALQNLLDKLFPAEKAAREMQAAFDLLNQKLAEGKIAPERYAEAVKKIPEAFSEKGGIKDQLTEILDQMNSFTKQFVDSVVDGIFEGKMNMEKLLKDMAKSITKWLLNQQIQNFFRR